MTTQHASLPRGRPREFDPKDVVKRAMNVFWSNGYDGTSLPDLLKATRLSRSSLYAAFGDKHGLFLQALAQYIEDSNVRFDSELTPTRPAFEGIRACLAGYVDRVCGTSGKRGCLVVATAMELAGRDPQVAKQIRRFFDGIERRLEASFTRARAEGDLAAHVDPADAARILLCVMEGLRVVGKTGLERESWLATVNALVDRFQR